jgi:TP901 family phage tail tape measure protein
MSDFVMGAEMRMSGNFSVAMSAATRMTNEFKNGTTAAAQTVTTLSDNFDAVDQQAASFSNGLQEITEATDSVVNPMNQAAQGVNRWKAAIQQFNRGAETLKALPSTIRRIAAQKLDGLENSIISTKLQAAALVSGIQAVAKTKLTNAVNNFKEFKATVTEGKAGLSGFATGLKNIGKISVQGAYNGVKNLVTKTKEFAATKLSGIVNGIKDFGTRAGGVKGIVGTLGTNLKNVAKVSFSALHAGIKKIGSMAVEAAGHVANKMGSAVKTVAKGLVVGITAASIALGGLGVAGIKAGIAYESAFAGVIKTVDATPVQLEKINSGIREMAKVMPTTAVEIAGVSEAAGQLGIQTDNILSFTETMVKLGDATNLTASDAATTLARFANVTGMSQSNFDRLGSTIVALGNNFATTESEIADMAQNIASAGTQVGLSEAQILGFSAALSSVGMESQAGGTAISKLMVDMQLATETGSSSLKDFAKVAGMSTSEFKTAFKSDAAGALSAFMTGLSDTKRLGKSAIAVLDDMGISEVRLRDTILRAANSGDLFTNALALGTDAWEENIALTKEANQRYNTMESQISMLKNSVTDLGIEFYQSVNNPIAEAVKTARSMVDDLSKAFKEGGIDGLVGEVGNVFAKIVTKIADAAPKVIEMAVSLVDNLLTGIQNNAPQIAQGAAKAVTAFIKGIVTMLPRIILIGADLLLEFAGALINELPQLLAAGQRAIETLFSGLASRLPQIIQMAGTIMQFLVSAILQNLPYLLQTGVTMLLNLLQGIINALPFIIQTALQLLQILINTLVANLPAIIQMGVKLLISLLQGIVSMLPSLIQMALQLIVSLVNGLLANLPLIIDAAIQLVMSLIVGILDMIPAIIQTAISLIITIQRTLLANQPAIIQAAIQIIIALIGGLLRAIPMLIEGVISLIGAMIETIFTTNWLQVGWDIVKGIGKGLWDGIKGVFGGAGKKGGEELVNGAVEGAQTNLGAITNASEQTATSFTTGLQPDYGAISNYGLEAGNSLTSGLTLGTSDLTTSAMGVGADMATGLSDGFTLAMPETVDTATLLGAESVTGLSTGMTNTLGLATSTATDVTTGVTDVFAGMNLKPSGENAMQGFVDGIKAMRSSVMAAAQEIADSVKLTVNSALDIRSPSRVMEESGEFTGEGFVNGIIKLIDKVRAAAQRLSNATIEPVAAQTAGAINPSGTAKAPTRRTDGLRIIIEKLILENVGEKEPKKLVKEILQLLYEELSGADEVLSLEGMGALL